MPTFPTNPAPAPAATPVDPWGKLRTPTVDPIQTGGVGGGPRSVSFTQRRPQGALTIDALLARQKAAVAGQQDALATPQATIAGGIGSMLTSYMEGMKGYKAEQEEQRGREEITQAMLGIPESGIIDPQGLATIMRRDPDLGLALYQEAMSARKTAAEQAAKQGEWEDMPAPEGSKPGQLYQRNKVTGEVRTAGGGAGTEVTINPPSAETGAKLGLAQGFLDNYDAIIKSATAGEMTGGGYIKSVQLGRGPGGIAYRNLLQGTEAMVRILTGAGMNESEARQRVTQYEPAITDDAETLVSKIQGLKQALGNVTEGVRTRGQGEKTEPDAAQPDAAAPPASDPTKPVVNEDGTLDFSHMSDEQYDAWKAKQTKKAGGG